jgi:antitoxin CptB
MTMEDDRLEDIETKRKRLVYRSWHRGTREMDLLMGSFADLHIGGFDPAQLAAYDEILHHSDPDLYNWITGMEPVPANWLNPVMELLIAHSFPAEK